jgi:hypothetical protein
MVLGGRSGTRRKGLRVNLIMTSEVHQSKINSKAFDDVPALGQRTPEVVGSRTRRASTDGGKLVEFAKNTESKRVTPSGPSIQSTLVNSVFGRVAKMMHEKTRKKEFPIAYYKRRHSMIHLEDESEDNQTHRSHFEMMAEDDLYVKFSEKLDSQGKTFRRRDKRLHSIIGKEGLKLVLAEALLIDKIRSHIRNKEMQEFIKLKLESFENFQKSKLLSDLKRPKITINQAQNKFDPIVRTSVAFLDPDVRVPRKKEGLSSTSTDKISQKTEKSESKVRNSNLKRSTTTKHKALGTQMNQQIVLDQLKISYARLGAYKPIIQFLSLYHRLDDLTVKLFFSDVELSDDLKQDPSIDKVLQSEIFLSHLIRSIVMFKESEIFEILLKVAKKWDPFFNEAVLSSYMIAGGIEYLLRFLKAFNSDSSDGMENPPLKSQFELQEVKPSLKSATYMATEGNRIPRGRLIQLLKLLLSNDASRDIGGMIIDFLKHLNISNQLIVELLMSTEEEAKILGIFSNNQYLAKEIQVKTILNTKMYSLLALIDQMELINIMNLSAAEDGSKSSTVFQKLCEHIKESGKIEPICNVFMNVNQTYWDTDKLWRLYLAINELLKYNKVQKWLASIANPLLFFMKLATFLTRVSRALDLDSLEITKLSKDLVDFCKFYILNTAEETLMLQVTDKDSSGFCMFEYAFMVKEMTILEIAFIEKIIHEMWDNSRHSKSSFLDFFKLCVLRKEVKHFSSKTFKKSYIMPIEETDMFQLEYFLTSRSTFLSVLSDIIWTTVLIVFEFWFALKIANYYKLNEEEDFNSSFIWLRNLAEDNGQLSYIFATLRCSYIISVISRWMVIGKENIVGHQISLFYNSLLIVFLLQLVVYPLLFSDSFMLLNLLQMILTLLMIGHCFFLGLSLDNLGVLLRIFSRMCYVVLIFAIVSMFIILIIAFPVHTITVDFTQKVSGLPYSELNMFRNLYNGVLTLFEFVFGAVVFVRPYLENNIYTYGTSLFMIIFSFFGNIMLANMLIAFLASQFSSILKSANYFTLKMQYGLTKVLRPNDLDSIYSMPFFLTPVTMIAYLFMIKPGYLRKSVNIILRKLIFFVNIFIPWILLYSVYLAFMIVFRFVGMYVQILSEAGQSKLKLPWFIILWTILGIPFLIKLYFEDLTLLLKVLLNLRDIQEKDLYQISISEEDRRRLLAIFNKIYKTAKQLRKKNIENANLGSFIYEIGKLFPKTFSPNHAHTFQHGQVGHQKDGSDDMSHMNKNNYMFKNKYKEESIKTYAALLKNYANLEEGSGGSTRSQMMIDIGFLLERCKNYLSIDRVHLLVAIDKPNLDRARKSFQRQEDEIGLQAELGLLNEKVDEISADMNNLIKNLLKMDGKMNKGFKGLIDQMADKTPKQDYTIKVIT